MKEFIVKNARVVDPSRGIDEVGEICVKDGVFCDHGAVARVGPDHVFQPRHLRGIQRLGGRLAHAHRSSARHPALCGRRRRGVCVRALRAEKDINLKNNSKRQAPRKFETFGAHAA